MIIQYFYMFMVCIKMFDTLDLAWVIVHPRKLCTAPTILKIYKTILSDEMAALQRF